MMAPSPLSVRGAPIPYDGIGMQWLVELACPRPTNVTLAIVLDLSDSCGSMRNEASKFPRFVVDMPRDMPVWLYRLSGLAPSNNEAHRITDLQDGRLQLINWLEDSRMRDFMALRGSLLRPVLESIVERKVRESVSQVKLVVLTDGELLDVGELSVPEGIKIIGLTASSIDPKCKHWRRVLPHVPIFDLLDPRVDSMFADVTTPFYGACEVSWCHADTTLTAMVVDLTSARISAVDRCPLVWNFADQSLMFVLEAAKPSSRPPTIICRSIRNNQSIERQLTAEVERLDAEIVAEATALLKAGAATQANVVLDVKAADPEFEMTRAQFLAAKVLAESRRPWVDAGAVARVWNGDAVAKALLGDDGKFRFDALVCFADLEPVDSADARIVVIALDKRLQPALRLGVGSLLDLGATSIAITIQYDMREARWMLSLENQSRELDPRYSQEIALPILSGQGVPVVALFSGPLR